MIEFKTRERIDDIAGRICKAVVPVRQEYHLGRGNSTAICTLSSFDLLDKISRTDALMDKIAIVGRLLSENKGIDAIIDFAATHPSLARMIICGKEVKGHRAGQALTSLAQNGTDSNGRIIGALGPHPTLSSSSESIIAFRNRVHVLNRIGTTEFETIVKLVA